MDLLWLGDVHLEESEAGGAGPLQFSGPVSRQVQHRGKHLKAQSIQMFRRRLPKTRVAACRDTGTRLQSPDHM